METDGLLHQCIALEAVGRLTRRFGCVAHEIKLVRPTDVSATTEGLSAGPPVVDRGAEAYSRNTSRWWHRARWRTWTLAQTEGRCGASRRFCVSWCRATGGGVGCTPPRGPSS